MIGLKINEVSKLLGLNRKTIRFYESKGLLCVPRQNNSYREYSAEDVRELRIIKALRTLGIGISDIKLYRHGVVSLRELLCGRMAELSDEKALHSRQMSACQALLPEAERGDALLEQWEGSGEEPLPETEGEPDDITEPVTVGIDIGTTTLSVVVLGADSGTSYDCFNVRNPGGADPVMAADGRQEPAAILQKIREILDIIRHTYRILSVGLTGQMHGILYVDADGQAVSELFTWQNRSGLLPIDGETCCEAIRRKSGENVPAGYGLATHYYLFHTGRVPERAASLCTVMDYLGMQLCGRSRPLVHCSNAASLGFFDIRSSTFRTEALQKAGLDPSILPDVTADNAQLGDWDGVPVWVALGDNQASFLGAVGLVPHSALINIGTGSQISVLCPSLPSDTKGFEIRPLIDGQYLKCYSALCGGAAYAALEKFFRRLVVLAGGENDELYDLLERMADSALHEPSELCVRPCFNGTRTDPTQRASVTGLSLGNFTPEQLTLGMLRGIAGELYEQYRRLPEQREVRLLAASGNAVRRNRVLRQILCDTFGMEPVIPDVLEEAAVGAARFAGRQAQAL